MFGTLGIEWDSGGKSQHHMEKGNQNPDKSEFGFDENNFFYSYSHFK